MGIRMDPCEWSDSIIRFSNSFLLTCLTVSNLLKDRINFFVWINQLSQLYQ